MNALRVALVSVSAVASIKSENSTRSKKLSRHEFDIPFDGCNVLLDDDRNGTYK